MDSARDAAAIALFKGICEFLGIPVNITSKIFVWQKGDFEVAVQRDVGPHVWLSDRWHPASNAFSGLSMERKDPTKTRHSGLDQTATLGKGHSAWCIKFTSNQTSAVLRCVKLCAIEAGVCEAQTDQEEGRDDKEHHGVIHEGGVSE